MHGSISDKREGWLKESKMVEEKTELCNVEGAGTPFKQ